MKLSGPLNGLVDALRGEFARDPRGREVARVLGAYAREVDDWAPYARFREGEYTRNLIELERDFELLLLCWSDGAASPIHNHEGQNCWMAVLQGPIQEVRYQMPAAGSRGPLQESSVLDFGTGEVAFIRDEIGLHLVRPLSGPGISLHLYSRPIQECDVYCPETGRVTRKKLGYHSVRGVPTEAVQA